jgi:hypothetical protein
MRFPVHYSFQLGVVVVAAFIVLAWMLEKSRVSLLKGIFIIAIAACLAWAWMNFFVVP